MERELFARFVEMQVWLNPFGIYSSIARSRSCWRIAGLRQCLDALCFDVEIMRSYLCALSMSLVPLMLTML